MHYILCIGKWSGLGSAVTSAYRHTTSPWLDRGLHHHIINPHRVLRRHTAGLHRPWYVATSERRALCSATSGPAWGLGAHPAVSSDRVINTKHINQLSRFHAQKLLVFNFVWFNHYTFFAKKLFVKNFLVKTLFVTHKFKYPIYLGRSFMKPFLLYMIIIVWLRSLLVYYAMICTMLT